MAEADRVGLLLVVRLTRLDQKVLVVLPYVLQHQWVSVRRVNVNLHEQVL
jgi:hypothetical protein